MIPSAFDGKSRSKQRLGFVMWLNFWATIFAITINNWMVYGMYLYFEVISIPSKSKNGSEYYSILTDFMKPQKHHPMHVVIPNRKSLPIQPWEKSNPRTTQMITQPILIVNG